eukprot:m.114276 g.114276  ORF g.114276 m.114276 type:complete len:692 (-) comp15472_c0_seq1:138-2213(-)
MADKQKGRNLYPGTGHKRAKASGTPILNPTTSHNLLNKPPRLKDDTAKPSGVLTKLLSRPVVTNSRSRSEMLKGKPTRTQVPRRLPSTTEHVKKPSSPAFRCNLADLDMIRVRGSETRSMNLSVNNNIITFESKRDTLNISKQDIKFVEYAGMAFCITLVSRKHSLQPVGGFFSHFKKQLLEGPEALIFFQLNKDRHVTKLLECLHAQRFETKSVSEERISGQRVSLMSNQLNSSSSTTTPKTRTRSSSPEFGTATQGTRRNGRRSSRKRSSPPARTLSTEDTTVLGTWPPGQGGITVTQGDFNRLQEHEFLNDIIINMYLKYLELEMAEADRMRVKIFNSFFYSQFRKHGFERVRRWTKNDKLFEKDFVVVPINESAHWYTAIICYPGEIYEPLSLLKAEEKDELVPMDTADTLVEFQDLESLYRPPSPEDDNGSPPPKQAHLSAVAGRSSFKTSPGVTKELDALPTTVNDEDILEHPSFMPGKAERIALDSPEPPVEPTHEPKTFSSEPLGCVAPFQVNPKSKCWVNAQVPRRPCILMLDSLGGVHRDNARDLRRYLKQLWEETQSSAREFDDDTMPLIQVDVPQQDNSTDCGIFLLSFIQSFLSGGPKAKQDMHPRPSMGFSYYSNGGKLPMKQYFRKGGSLLLSRPRVRKLIQEKLDALPKKAIVVDDETKTTHHTNDDGEDIIELD